MNNWYDILSMTQVGHRLFVSGYARAADLAKDNPSKITAVLCVHQVMDYDQNPNIIYMHVPFNDGEGIPPQAFVKCLGWLKFMYENGHTILIHCAAGISRSVTILASFMHYEGIADFNEALNVIRMNRPNASPAPAVLRSAKQMLKVGEYGDPRFIPVSEPEHERTMADVIEAIQSQRAAYAHTDLACPMRKFLLSQQDSNVPRHTIPCSCEKLTNPLEIASQRDKIIIEIGVNCISCGKGIENCECV